MGSASRTCHASAAGGTVAGGLDGLGVRVGRGVGVGFGVLVGVADCAAAAADVDVGWDVGEPSGSPAHAATGIASASSSTLRGDRRIRRLVIEHPDIQTRRSAGRA
jgi:hypothetical protein